jgi:hypothetical protein
LKILNFRRRNPAATRAIRDSPPSGGSMPPEGGALFRMAPLPFQRIAPIVGRMTQDTIIALASIASVAMASAACLAAPRGLLLLTRF